MEAVSKEVFPDIRTRPNYIAGALTHGIWSFEEPETHPDAFSRLLAVKESALVELDSRNSLSIKHAPGSLLLGPVVAVDGETPQQARKREKETKYFISALLAATTLGTRYERDAKKLVSYRIRNLAINSVVWPMTIRYECYNGGILENEERRDHARSRLKEAARMIYSLDSSITYEFLERLLRDYVAMTKDRINMMFTSVFQGRTSSIDVSHLLQITQHWTSSQCAWQREVSTILRLLSVFVAIS